LGGKSPEKGRGKAVHSPITKKKKGGRACTGVVEKGKAEKKAKEEKGGGEKGNCAAHLGERGMSRGLHPQQRRREGKKRKKKKTLFASKKKKGVPTIHHPRPKLRSVKKKSRKQRRRV